MLTMAFKLLTRSRYYGIGIPCKRNFSQICVNEEIKQSLFEKKAVVALESTIITHGMRFPGNFKTAIEVQNIIREQDAIPATIAVVKGQIKVGLSEQELEELSFDQKSCLKISRRDFPYAISQKLTGGTTVSGTMVIAHKLGIPIFVTGGIGGVHREMEYTLDISADLNELGRTPVAVISSGVKSILDIGKTLEYLETEGVAVATYGPSKVFPAFYCRESKFESPYNLTSYKEAAKFIQTIFNLELNSGILIGVPIPEKHSLNEDDTTIAIEEGLKKAQESGIKGKNVTPFLLSKVAEITKGKSLEANISLIKNNASVGGRIAVELSKLRRDIRESLKFSVFDLGRGCGSESKSEVEVKSDKCVEKVNSEVVEKSDKFNVVVVGGTNLDYIVNISERELKPKAVFFTCIDSRMIPTRFTETCVGDMFVVRNAGNIIPHSRFYPDEVTTNEPAALELGCVINNIRHIIVCGHSDCKAMNLLYALRDKEYSSLTSKRISPLRAWMCTHATSSLNKFLKMEAEGSKKPLVFHAETPLNKFVAYIDPENQFRTEDKLSQVHTLQQLQNIASYDFLRSRLEQRDLHVHALWFDIYTGEVYYFSRSAKQFVVINEDTIMRLLQEMDGRTIGGKIYESGGGVARNIADALGKLPNINPFLITAIGKDNAGYFIKTNTISHLSQKGITDIADVPTGKCVAICDHTGECLFLVGDMNIHQEIKVNHLKKYEKIITGSSLVVFDGDLDQNSMNFLMKLCSENSVPVWYEPTDLCLAKNPFLNKEIPLPNFISPNHKEFLVIYEALFPNNKKSQGSNLVEDCILKAYEMSTLIENIIVTLGKEGVVIIRKGEDTDCFFDGLEVRKYVKREGRVSHRHYRVKPLGENELVNVLGAGDCFSSGFISGMLNGKPEKLCVESGFRCSAASLKSSNAVPSSFFLK